MPYGSVADLPPAFNNLSTAEKEKAVQMLNAMMRDADVQEPTGTMIATVLKRVQQMNLSLRTAAFAQAPGEGDLSEPFEILRAGEFVYRGEDMTIAESDLDKAVANFQAKGQEIPVDYDHSFAEGGTSRAAGWIKELFKKGTSLFARVKWTDEAKKEIQGEHFRFFSSEFSENWADESGDSWGFTLLAGALTNRPFLKGMSPVALSEKAAKEIRLMQTAGIGEMEAEISALRERVERGDTPSEVPETFTVEIDGKARKFTAEQISELVQKASEKEATELSVKVGEETKTFTAEQVAELASKADEVKATEKAKEQAEGEAKKLSDRISTIETELREERFNAAFKQAQREGRVDAKDETREKWAKRVERFGLEATTELLNELPAETIPVSERGSGEAAAEVVPDGTDPDAVALDRKIKAYCEKHDLDAEDPVKYAEAAEKVMLAEARS